MDAGSKITRAGNGRKMMRRALIFSALLILAPSLALADTDTAPAVILHDCMLVFRYGSGSREGVQLAGGEARDINRAGSVVGWLATEEGDIHAVLWEYGRSIDLGTLGGANSCALGVNDRDQVVGWAETDAGERLAVRWDDGVATALGAFPGEFSVAYEINNSGDAAGLSYPAYVSLSFPVGRAVLWSGDNMEDLSAPLEPAGSGAFDINDDGVISGWLIPNGGAIQAARWQNGEVSMLETEGWTRSTAHATNGSGETAGWATSGENDEIRAGMRWLGTSPGVALVNPLGSEEGEACGTAWDINSAGVIVGSARTGEDDLFAVLWRDVGEPASVLPQLGGAKSEAYALNDVGDVVGWSLDADLVPRPVIWASGLVVELRGFSAAVQD